MVFKLKHEYADSIELIKIPKVVLLSLARHSRVCDNIPEGEDITEEVATSHLQVWDPVKNNVCFEFPSCCSHGLTMLS